MSKVGTTSKMTVAGFGTIALSTLGTRVVLSMGDISVQVVGGTLISMKAAITVLGADSFDGPFLVGLATRNLTAAQIEAAMESNGPSGPTHSTQTELSSRFRHIRTLGILKPDPAETLGPYTLWIDEVIKLGWAEQDGGWLWWIYNLGPNLVTGATWEVTERAFVVYDRD